MKKKQLPFLPHFFLFLIEKKKIIRVAPVKENPAGFAK